MKTADVSEYKQLESFGDTVLAATHSESHGFMFCTWKQNEDGGSVFWGDYSPDYEYTKESFAIHSGLVSEHRLFSEKESAYLYHCIDFAKTNCETLTYKQDRQLHHDENDPKYAQLGRGLVQSGNGIFTEYGLLFVDENTPFNEVYDGQVFSAYILAECALHCGSRIQRQNRISVSALRRSSRR